MEKIDMKSLTCEELAEELEKLDLPVFRAKQIYQWTHQKLVESFDDMTNISKDLRSSLKEIFDFITLSPVDVRVSRIDGTRKYLFALPDGHIIESVLMNYKYGNSVCISSQVGCRMGCRFCASTLDGLVRNLTSSEMLEQVYRIQKDVGQRITHVVVMGSGEPLDNYDNFIRFIHLLNSKEGLNISQRSITVSTCGIVPGIRRLAGEHLQITLALSLHAPNDQIRRTLMPSAATYHLTDILDACQEYFEETGRRVTFEYSLVKGVNDNLEEAKALVHLIKNMHGHVNLIPVNPINEREFVQPGGKSIEDFKKYLEKNGIHVTIRREMGRDIGGACGQLRKSYLNQKKEG